MAVSLIAPVLYIAFLFGPLYVFSKYYMNKKKYRPAGESWFPTHHTRDLYISLLSHDPQPETPLLASALLRRAMTDVQRIVQIRESKQALTSLHTKGLVGDDFFHQFEEAEKELEAELMEVLQEANTFKPNWGQAIFAQANDMVQHEKLQRIVEGVREKHQAKEETQRALHPSEPVAAPTTTTGSKEPDALSVQPDTSNSPTPTSTRTTTPTPPTAADDAPTSASDAPSKTPTKKKKGKGKKK